MVTKTAGTTGRDFTDPNYWDQLTRKSLLRFFLLAALNRKPMHGYAIAGEVAACCESSRPTDAMIYPVLKELHTGGYLACESEPAGGRERKVCRLTAKGESAYRAAAEVWLSYLPHLVASVAGAPGVSIGTSWVPAGCCGFDSPGSPMEGNEE